MDKEKNYMYFVLQMLISIVCSWIFVTYMQISNSAIVIFPIAIVFCYLQTYTKEKYAEFRNHKFWYLIFAIGISATLIACKHIVMKFYDFYSGVEQNYILEYTFYDVFSFFVLIYIFLILEFSLVKLLSSRRMANVLKGHIKGDKRTNIGISSTKKVVIITGIIIACWLPYLILYYPGFIYGDSTNSLDQILGKASYSNMHPFMFTMFIKFCFFLGNAIGLGNTGGCLIYSILQMLYIGGIFAYSICWLENKNISKKICFIVLLFFALPRFWGQHAISMWKDPIFAATIYFYCLKLFDLIYSKGEASKDKKYTFECLISILVICFSRNNGVYVALFCLVAILVCSYFGKCSYSVKKGFIFVTIMTIVLSWMIQGPIYNYFGIYGSAAGAYGIPLQQVARTVVYDGNISEEERDFLNEIMPIDKYVDNYSPGLVDHIKWSPDFNSDFFGANHKEFFKVWLSLLIKNPKTFIEAWAMETCGFWGVSYWHLNEYLSNSSMGVPREHEFLMEEYDINFNSLLQKYSSLDDALKKYFAIGTPIPSVALCLWIALFMTLYAVIKGKWRYVLAFCPSFGVIGTLLIATPICYWPRYGLSSICLLPISILFPYLIMGQKGDNEEVTSQ